MTEEFKAIPMGDVILNVFWNKYLRIFPPLSSVSIFNTTTVT